MDALDGEPGVRSARVNLTLKRATVEADADIEPKALADYLGSIGFEAYELDAGTLSALASKAPRFGLTIRGMYELLAEQLV